MENSPVRVILADDHAVVRAGIRQFLERAGDIEILGEAGDGEQAKDLILRLQPDVAVLDIQMPAATGIEVTRWVRVHAPDTAVLVLTAYDDDPYVIAVLQAGANGYVLKTASPLDIIQAVRDVHIGKSAIHPAVAHRLAAAAASYKNERLPDELSEREIEVLLGIARGFTNKAIALQLGISSRTVQGHIAHIFEKLHSASRTEAVMRGIALGLVPKSVIENPPGEE